MRKILRLALIGLLLVALVAGADDESHDGHDHGDDDDGHDHGDDHGMWGGSFELRVGVSTLTLAKVGGKYADDHLVISLHMVGAGDKLNGKVSTMAVGTLEHALEKTSEEVEAECEKMGTDMGTEDCPMHVAPGGVLDLDGLEAAGEEEDDHAGHDHGRRGAAPRRRAARREDHATSKVFVLEMDQDSDTTSFQLAVFEEGTYAMFAEHPISEFEGEEHYLKGPGGAELEPIDMFTGELVDECVVGLNIQQVWGLSMAGALIGAAMSLSGALLMICFGVQRLAACIEEFRTINAFAAGILIGLVFIHLLPEGAALNGALDWVISVCFVAGLLLGLGTEHILTLLGFEHSHSGHSRNLTSQDSGSQQAVPLVVGQQAVPFVGGPVMTYNREAYFAAPIPPQPPLPPKTLSAVSGVSVSGSHFGEPSDPVKIADVELSADTRVVNWGTVTNIFMGDFFHNLFDGVAIAAAFASCGDLGWVVTASVIVHELPQELSDFAILVKAGLSVSTALLFNLASSLSSVVGVIIGVLVQQSGDATTATRDIGRVLAFSAGILLYVGMGLAGEIPRTKDKMQSALSWLALCAGIIINGVLILWHVHCDRCNAIGGGHEGHDH